MCVCVCVWRGEGEYACLSMPRDIKTDFNCKSGKSEKPAVTAGFTLCVRGINILTIAG